MSEAHGLGERGCSVCVVRGFVEQGQGAGAWKQGFREQQVISEERPPKRNIGKGWVPGCRLQGGRVPKARPSTEAQPMGEEAGTSTPGRKANDAHRPVRRGGSSQDSGSGFKTAGGPAAVAGHGMPAATSRVLGMKHGAARQALPECEPRCSTTAQADEPEADRKTWGPAEAADTPPPGVALGRAR